MPAQWDPAQYLRHADHRTRPFHDLLARVPTDDPATVVDLGCGPGNATATLRRRWPRARVLGIDNSPAMIEAARQYADERLDFALGDATGYTPDGVDVLLSNAALQWIPGHADLFPRWIEALPKGGVLAFQVPGNFEAPSHTLLAELRTSPRWRDRLGEAAERGAAVQQPAEYLDRLAALGCAADVWETTYLQVLQGENPVLDWVKGTALRPVLTALADDPEARDAFLAEYGAALLRAYPPRPYGTVLPFRRIFAVAVKH
jgi:trans-aconitate 2-methyltransferase